MKRKRQSMRALALLAIFFVHQISSTASPSHSPTSSPKTCVPSSSPSGFPSFSPSGAPTVGRPTVHPSNKPTNKPTAHPRAFPSNEPSSTPSSRPSSRPSSKPTEKPTGWPSHRPSSSPTCIPSARPSSRPSKRPITQPSIWPSKMPFQGDPSVSPSISKPTKAPSRSDPSLHPTLWSPSLIPTSASPSPPPTSGSPTTTAKPTPRPSPPPTSAEPSPPPTSNAEFLAAQEASRLMSMFNQLDADKDSQLDKTEYSGAWSKLNLELPSLNVTEHVFTKLDANEDGFIDDNEFIEAVSSGKLQELSKEYIRANTPTAPACSLSERELVCEGHSHDETTCADLLCCQWDADSSECHASKAQDAPCCAAEHVSREAIVAITAERDDAAAEIAGVLEVVGTNSTEGDAIADFLAASENTDLVAQVQSGEISTDALKDIVDKGVADNQAGASELQTLLQDAGLYEVTVEEDDQEEVEVENDATREPAQQLLAQVTTLMSAETAQNFCNDANSMVQSFVAKFCAKLGVAADKCRIGSVTQNGANICQNSGRRNEETTNASQESEYEITLVVEDLNSQEATDVSDTISSDDFKDNAMSEISTELSEEGYDVEVAAVIVSKVSEMTSGPTPSPVTAMPIYFTSMVSIFKFDADYEQTCNVTMVSTFLQECSEELGADCTSCDSGSVLVTVAGLTNEIQNAQNVILAKNLQLCLPSFECIAFEKSTHMVPETDIVAYQEKLALLQGPLMTDGTTTSTSEAPTTTEKEDICVSGMEYPDGCDLCEDFDHSTCDADDSCCCSLCDNYVDLDQMTVWDLEEFCAPESYCDEAALELCTQVDAGVCSTQLTQEQIQCCKPQCAIGDCTNDCGKCSANFREMEGCACRIEGHEECNIDTSCDTHCIFGCENCVQEMKDSCDSFECHDYYLWEDSEGFGCSAYATCTDPGWKETEKEFPEYYKSFADADGHTARDACCQCGGGHRKKDDESSSIWIIILGILAGLLALCGCIAAIMFCQQAEEETEYPSSVPKVETKDIERPPSPMNEEKRLDIDVYRRGLDDAYKQSDPRSPDYQEFLKKEGVKDAREFQNKVTQEVLKESVPGSTTHAIEKLKEKIKENKALDDRIAQKGLESLK